MGTWHLGCIADPQLAEVVARHFQPMTKQQMQIQHLVSQQVARNAVVEHYVIAVTSKQQQPLCTPVPAETLSLSSASVWSF
jgi:hypothetical protein